jgi:glucose 1-dehydrogenase
MQLPREEMLTKTVALELADKGIRVNGIAPGSIATDMNKELLENKEEKEKKNDKFPYIKSENQRK